MSNHPNLEVGEAGLTYDRADLEEAMGLLHKARGPPHSDAPVGISTFLWREDAPTKLCVSDLGC